MRGAVDTAVGFRGGGRVAALAFLDNGLDMSCGHLPGYDLSSGIWDLYSLGEEFQPLKDKN